MTVAKDKAVFMYNYYSYSKGKREMCFLKIVSPCSFGESCSQGTWMPQSELNYLLPKCSLLRQATCTLPHL